MPRIIRWFPVTHEINADPELWELREIHGDRAGFIWLECLSIADRNDGVVGPASDQTRNQLASKCRTSRVKVESVLDWCRVKGWLVFGEHVQVANYKKYHRSEERKKLPSYPNLPNLPDLPKPYKDESASPTPDLAFFSVQDFVDTWNQFFKDTPLPKVELPLSASRQRKAALRCKEHKSEEFWRRVFDNIAASQFLMGAKNGTWRCNFDFLIANDTNVIKIYEGSYNDAR